MCPSFFQYLNLSSVRNQVDLALRDPNTDVQRDSGTIQSVKFLLYLVWGGSGFVYQTNGAKKVEISELASLGAQSYASAPALRRTALETAVKTHARFVLSPCGTLQTVTTMRRMASAKAE